MAIGNNTLLNIMTQKPDQFKTNIISSPQFKEDGLKGYDLVIRVSPFSINYVIGSKSTNEIIQLGSHVYKNDNQNDRSSSSVLETACQEMPIIKEAFKSVNVIIVNQKCTLIPDALFNPADKEHYLSFNIDLDAEDRIFSTHVNAIKAQCIYAIAGKQHYLLSKLLHQPKFNHIAAVFTSGANDKDEKKSHEAPDFYLYVSNNMFFVYVMRKHEFTFFNNFIFNSPDEFIYYILNISSKIITKESKLTNFYLSGDIDEASTLYKVLQEQFDNLFFMSLPVKLKEDSVFSNINWHNYYDLIKLLF